MGATLTFAAALVLAGPPPLAADTLVDVRRGERVRIETPSGSVDVRTWERDVLRLDGLAAGAMRKSGNEWHYDAPRGVARRRAQLTLTVPSWMEVEIAGQSVEVDAAGLAGGLSVSTLSGDVRLAEVAGRTAVRTVSGTVWARGLRGEADIFTVEGDVTVDDARGELRVGSTDGDLVLTAIRADALTAEVTDGDVRFEGEVPPGARIRLAAHDGDLDVTLPEAVDAEVRVSTFDGEFMPAFAVRASGFRAGEALEFVLGRGGASITLETFDGDILLRRR